MSPRLTEALEDGAQRSGHSARRAGRTAAGPHIRAVRRRAHPRLVEDCTDCAADVHLHLQDLRASRQLDQLPNDP